MNPEQAKRLRLVLTTPPDGRPLHNPDNLTAEQVGAGFRLTLPDEKLDQNYEYWLFTGGWEKGQRKGLANDLNPGASMRLPLSVPWPEPQPDPYADLKAAHAAGKVIQFLDNGDIWRDIEPPSWCLPVAEYRIKPTPAFQLPPAPPGMRWHREDGWQEGDLPQGWRPLACNEAQLEGDEFWNGNTWEPIQPNASGDLSQDFCNPRRTRRPLTFEHAGKSWTWHRPGDPMPCDGETKVACVFVDHNVWDDGLLCAHEVNWGDDAGQGCIIGWRYADEKKTVPLGPEDVPPGSVFRHYQWKPYSFRYPKEVNEYGVHWTGDGTVHSQPHNTHKFDILKEDRWQINRSIPLTGKWDANAWEPCSKQI